MNRREFLKISQAFGLSLPLQPALGSSGTNHRKENNNIESVIIVGAGAAGLSAAYLLQQQGIDFQTLEASPVYGGRMKRTTEFVNFPIPLGAEWIHVDPDILEETVNDESVKVDIETTLYDPDIDYGLYNGERISLRDADFTEDSKFINATWFDFFEQYIVPPIKDQIFYNTIVEAIDYTSETIQVKTQNKTYFADRVIVAVPVKILQNGAVSFTPELPKTKQNAIEKVRVWEGCKAFIEFSKQFYPALVAFEIIPTEAGQKLYYDASYGQKTSQHVLGLFAVGTGAHPYLELSDEELIKYILTELDEIFDGQASQNYLKHIFQNWNEEPYVNGAYVMDDENWQLYENWAKASMIAYFLPVTRIPTVRIGAAFIQPCVQRERL